MLLKRIISVVILVLIAIVVVGCDFNDTIETNDNENNLTITYDKPKQTLSVGESFTLNRYIGLEQVYYESSDDKVVVIKTRFGYAAGVGYALITARNNKTNKIVETFLVEVISNKPTAIRLVNYKDLDVGSSYYLGISYTPTGTSGNIIYSSSDESIATVDKNGKVTGIESGFVRIKAELEDSSDVFDEVIIYVKNHSYSNDEIANIEESSTKTIDVSTLYDVFEPIIKKAQSYVVGVKSYAKTGAKVSTLSDASGVIFERYCVLKDGSTVLDDGNVKEFVTYKYYVITCKHIIDGATDVEVTYGDKTVSGEVISFDTKIDLGVISFIDNQYFPVATFADSNTVETGEFVLTVGNNYGSDYFDSITLGVVSYYSRYVSTDTDNDGTNDWDALYIQHDAAIGEGSSGGPLVNMKGEVIGINSIKISSAKIDNMGFAIPSNLTIELCNQLKEGIVPARPVFKISVLTVRDIIKNEYLLELYPIPEGFNYGIYIAEVDSGGVGEQCGMKAGDIIVEFDGKKITYSYELRAAMGSIIIGSNEEINVVVYRNGEYITLKAVF